MPPKYTLYAPPGSFRAFAPLVAAEINQIDVDVVTEDIEKVVAEKSPTGKAPLLETPDGVIFSSHAMARYIGALRRDTGLLGRNTQEKSSVNAWMDWCAQEVELPCCVWFYPVAGYLEKNESNSAKAAKDLGAALGVLNDALQDKTFLIHDSLVTLADIVIASTLLYPFKFVADATYLKPYPNVVRWFQNCVGQQDFAAGT